MSHNNGFDEWGGYMDAKITKLEEQFSVASDPYRQSNIFAGVSIFVNGRTDPSADELKRIMMTHGGTYHHYERSHTTYIIAENLPDVKVRQMQNAKKNIIRAKWVVDCVKEKRLIDYAPYLLYTNQKTTQPRLEFDKIRTATTTTTTTSTVTTKATAEIAPLICKNNDEESSKEKQLEVLKANLEALRKQILSASSNDTTNVVTTTTTTTTVTNANSTNIATTKTAKDENFLTEFYSNSRLHHIATLGANFKQYITNLRENGHKDFTSARLKLKQALAAGESTTSSGAKTTSPSKIVENCIMHIDMDCFFVSVGLRKHAHLRNQPVAVTHSRGGGVAGDVTPHVGAIRNAERELWMQRQKQHIHDKVQNGFDSSNYSLSEISSCSYEARQCGIKNGMLVGQALKLCPNLKTIPYDFEGYKEVAQQLYDTIAQYTLDIEAVSCDEMFVDLTSLLHDIQTTPMQLVRQLRQEVRDITACPCSAGVGPNKLLARMATKRAKPDGQFVLWASEAEAYMASMLVSDLPGVGGSTTYALKQAGVFTCEDLQKMSLPRLQMIVGKKSGDTLKQFCRGIDNRPLLYVQVRKSVSAEVNYGIRFKEEHEVNAFLTRLSDEVHARLMEIKRRTKCINLKIMVRAKDAPVETAKYMGHGVCDSFSKATALKEYTNNKLLIRNTVLSTMKAMAVAPCELRGIGIQLTKLNEQAAGGTSNQELRDKHGIEQLFKRAAEKQKQKPLEITNNHKALENSKNYAINKTKDVMKRAPNVINMLKDAVKKQKRECPQIDLTITSQDIDIDQGNPVENNCEEFLEILPKTLRNEVANSVKQLQQLEMSYAAEKQQKRLQQQENKEHHEFNTIQIENNNDNSNIFKEADFEKVIISWIKNCHLTGPSETDVQIIIDHATCLIQDQSYYYQLYGQLNWLCKFLGNYRDLNACQWHAASKKIKKSLQEQLILHYGLPFLIPDTIVCDKCEKN